MDQLDWPATLRWIGGAFFMVMLGAIGALRKHGETETHEGSSKLILGSITEKATFDAFVTALATQTAATNLLTATINEMIALMKAELKQEEETKIRMDERRRLEIELGLKK